MRLTYEQMMERAAYIAARAHEGQRRKDGSPYIGHPIRVMAKMQTIQGKIVAILHDVIEDTPVTLEELREEGFTEEILHDLDAVTKRPNSGETYMDFIVRICEAGENPILVKIADIEDNLGDQSALDKEEAEFLSARYNRALPILFHAYERK